MNDALLRLALILIAAITVLSGLAQMFAPGFVLNLVGGDTATVSRHMFATVGMFMFITGAMFLQSLWKRSREPAIPLWIGVQKLAAAVLVGLGYTKGFFGVLGLAVAGFDLFSGVLALWFLYRINE